MKKLLLLVTFAALLISTQAMAQYTWEDNLGIFLDDQASTNCGYVTATDVYPAYLMITRLTSSSVGGWEVKITSSGGGVISAVNPRGDFINAANRQYEYIVGLGSPLLPTNGYLVIADIDFVIFDLSVPFKAFIGPVYYDTLGNGLPAYLDGEDPNLVKRLVPATWDLDYPQLLINGLCGTVENEESSFGTVKALFR